MGLNMKNLLVATLLLSAVPFSAEAADLMIEEAAIAPAPAASGMAGYIEVSGLRTEFDNYIFAGFGVSGALAYYLDDNWQLQTEFRLQAASTDVDEYSGLDTGIAALHLNYYGDGYSVGAFGGVVAMNEYYDEGLGYSVFGGVEAQVNVTDDVLLGGQVGYSRQVSGVYMDDYAMNFFFGQADLKFFPMDNLKLQASVGVARGDMWKSDGIGLLSAAIEAEYQFEDTPFSVFASYTYTNENAYDFDNLDHAVARVGARFSFDGESLKEQATSGASHKVYDFTGVAALRWW